MTETGQRELGASGLVVPAIGIGTDSWGEKLLGYGKRYAADDLFAAYRACLDAGLSFFDTAEGYARGDSERLLGEFRRRDGREIIIATKFDNHALFSPNRRRRSARSIQEALDGSLRRLGVERIDLYQVHFALKPEVIDEYMEVLAGAVQAGKIRTVGVSNFNAALMHQAHSSLAARGVPLASNQVSYNLLHRYPETNGVLDACRDLRVALIPCIPLAVGILTGKYRHGAAKLTHFQRLFFRLGALDPFKECPERGSLAGRLLAKPRELRFGALEPMFAVIEEIAEARGKSIVQVALNWLLTTDSCVIPIPGAKNERQARENAGVLGWSLTQEEHGRIGRAEAEAR